MIWTIEITLETTKPNQTDEEIEARCLEFDMIRDKLEIFFEQAIYFLPDDWRVSEVEEA